LSHGHGRIRGNEIADRLTGSAHSSWSIAKDKSDILNAVLDRICKEDESEWEENVHIRRMVEITVRKGKGRTSILTGRELYTYYQRITGTINGPTLRWLMEWATEQLREYPDCRNVSLF
jgi:hypothetical protein